MKKPIRELVFALLLPVFFAGPLCWGQAPRDPDPAAEDPEEEFAESFPWVDQVRRQGGFLELGIKDAVRLALSNNLEIAIEDYNEGITRELITSAEGFYDPQFSFGARWDSREFPAISILEAGRGITTSSSKNLGLTSSISQQVPGGGAFEFQFNNSRRSNNSLFSTINPNYWSTSDFSFTQPLWRGFRKTQTEHQLKLYNLDRRIDDGQFKERVTGIIQQVQEQYWELVSAINDHEIRRQSRELAILQHRDNKKRVNIGILAPIEVSRSRTEVSTREKTVIQSEVQIIRYQNALKRLLAPDPNASMWSLTLIPTDRPEVRDVEMTLKDAIKNAFASRPELERIRLQLEKNQVDYDFYKNVGKPRVNLRANIGSVGTSGQTFRNVDFLGALAREPDPDHPFSGNLGTSVSRALGFDFIDYGVGVEVTIPLRNRVNEGDLARTAIAERQLRSQLKSQQMLIVEEVRNAFESITTQKKQLEVARLALQLSGEQLDLETRRFEAGLSNNFELLTYQRDLAEAQVQELRAQIDYQLAVMHLQRAMNTIVTDSDIVLARGQNGG